MGFFKWKDEFSVNNPRLDHQHQLFLDTLNKMHSRIGSVESFEVFKQSVTTLGHYIDFHFADEEDFLASIGYPYLEQQKREHDFFRARVAELENSYQKLSATELGKLLVFMRDWLLKHILESDQQYARFTGQNH